MKPTSRKNRELIQQYPFLEQILVRTRFALRSEKLLDDLTIKYQIADGNLMFAQANNIGLDGNSWTWRDSKAEEIGKRCEHLFAVNKDNKLINRLDWSANGRDDDHLYGRLVLWGTKLGNGHYTDPLYEQVEYLVWVTLEHWHEDLKDADDRFGALKRRAMHITIYGKPEQGFEALDRSANIADNLFLSSHVLIRAAINKDYEINVVSGRLEELCTLFQDEVYYNGMRDIANDPKYRICGSGQFGATKVLVAEMCDYQRIMLEDNECWVSFQIRPDAQRMYVLGVGGRLPQIRRLVKTAVDMWNKQPESRANFKHDRNVSVM